MRGVHSPPCKESRGCFRGLSTTTGETPPTSNPSETEEAAPPSNPSPLEEPSAIEGNKQKLHCPIAVFPLELSFKRRQCWMHCYGQQDNPSSQKRGVAAGTTPCASGADQKYTQGHVRPAAKSSGNRKPMEFFGIWLPHP